MPVQKVAAVAAHQLLEVSEPNQREVVTTQNGHPVRYTLNKKLTTQQNRGLHFQNLTE